MQQCTRVHLFIKNITEVVSCQDAM